jgi:hypothetical protein
MHETVPLELYIPTGQLMHWAFPVALLYWPAAHTPHGEIDWVAEN